MPLVKTKNDDDAFLREVASHMMGDCTRMQEHTTAMIEEYLRHKLQIHEHQLREEFDKEKSALHAARAEVEDKLQSESEELHKMERTVSNLCGALSTSREKCTMMHYFHTWRHFTQERHHCHSIARLECDHNHHEWLRRSFYWPWRLFATVRRCQRQSNEHIKRAQHETEEIREKYKDMEMELMCERQRYKELEQKYTDGFVDGVSALNRTAINVLHGKDEREMMINTQNEEDVAAIESILRRENRKKGSHALWRTAERKNVHYDNNSKSKQDEEEELEYEEEYEEEDENEEDDYEGETRDKRHFHKNAGEEMDGKFANLNDTSHLTSHAFVAPSKKTSLRQTHRQEIVDGTDNKEYDPYAARGICPVHFTDAEGNFYHRCLADPIARNRSQNTPYIHSCNAPTMAHQPFVVRPNVDSVRSVNIMPNSLKKNATKRTNKAMHFKEK